MMTGPRVSTGWKYRVEVDWRLARCSWGRGLATEAALASVRYGFEKLGIERIISITLPENVAWRWVREKAGLISGVRPSGEVSMRSGTILASRSGRPTTEADELTA